MTAEYWSYTVLIALEQELGMIESLKDLLRGHDELVSTIESIGEYFQFDIIQDRCTFTLATLLSMIVDTYFSCIITINRIRGGQG